MRKKHVTQQFFRASRPQGHFFEKTKNLLLDMVWGPSVFTKFQVCILFRLARRSRTNPQFYTYTSELKKTHSTFVTWILTTPSVRNGSLV